MNYLSSSYINVDIFGNNIIPSEISSDLGIDPNDIHHEESPNISGVFHLKDCWRLKRISKDANEGLDEIISDIEEFLEPKIEIIKKFLTINSLNLKVYVVIESRNAEDNGVFLDNRFINMLTALNGTLEVDCYNY